jgi:superfamily II DNA helicase RecQ
VLEGRPYLSCVVRWNGACAPDAPRATARESRRAARGRREPPAEAAELDARGQRTFAALRAWRSERARELGVPAYRVLTNRQLTALARARPADLAALERIEGIGPATCRQHGERILARLRES